MGDEKTGATKLPGWSEKGLLLTEKNSMEYRWNLPDFGGQK
jgi:hypothetical protein